MKKIQLKDITYLFIEVPDDFIPQKYGALDARNNCIWGKSNWVTYTIPIDEKDFSIPYSNMGTQPEIISTIEDITEESCKQIVEGFFKHEWSENFDCWKNYHNPCGVTYSKTTAKESLDSLIQANELDVNKNYLILKNND
jgi:hypothetical protein